MRPPKADVAAEVARPDDSAIPDCPICKSKRRFEFQILPTLVSFIVPKESVEFNDTTLDFGSIAVYCV